MEFEAHGGGLSQGDCRSLEGGKTGRDGREGNRVLCGESGAGKLLTVGRVGGLDRRCRTLL